MIMAERKRHLFAVPSMYGRLLLSLSVESAEVRLRDAACATRLRGHNHVLDHVESEAQRDVLCDTFNVVRSSECMGTA